MDVQEILHDGINAKDFIEKHLNENKRNGEWLTRKLKTDTCE